MFDLLTITVYIYILVSAQTLGMVMLLSTSDRQTDIFIRPNVQVNRLCKYIYSNMHMYCIRVYKLI